LQEAQRQCRNRSTDNIPGRIPAAQAREQAEEQRHRHRDHHHEQDVVERDVGHGHRPERTRAGAAYH
jgi:hypothetical protein